jgi:hypothetical protein
LTPLYKDEPSATSGASSEAKSEPSLITPAGGLDRDALNALIKQLKAKEVESDSSMRLTN